MTTNSTQSEGAWAPGNHSFKPGDRVRVIKASGPEAGRRNGMLGTVGKFVLEAHGTSSFPVQLDEEPTTAGGDALCFEYGGDQIEKVEGSTAGVLDVGISEAVLAKLDGLLAPGGMRVKRYGAVQEWPETLDTVGMVIEPMDGDRSKTEEVLLSVTKAPAPGPDLLQLCRDALCVLNAFAVGHATQKALALGIARAEGKAVQS